MAEQELISVVIPTCRRDAQTVRRAAASALDQTHRAVELFVVDDSPDGFPGRDEVRSALEALSDPRVRYVRHEVNQGACAARNTGLGLSSGRYVAFLDDDDEWLPEKLERQLAKFREAGGDCGLVGCGSITVNDRTGERKERGARQARGMVFDRLILENFIGSTSFPLIRRECFDACGPFDTRMKSAQDYEMWLRIAQKYPVDYVDEPLVLYHESGGPRISTNVSNRIQGLERLGEIHAGYLAAHPAARSARLLKLIPHYLRAGERQKARRAFFEAARLRPFALKDNLGTAMQFFKRPQGEG
jgi:glycosyltransferase involved in cell wall biosynthesis